MALALDPRNVSAAVLVVLAIAVAIAGARWWIRGSLRWAAAHVALAAAVVVTAPVMTARVVIPDYDRGPLRPGNDRGFQATVDYLNRTALPGASLLGPKDIGYYHRGRFYGLEGLVANGGSRLAESVADRPDVRYIVDSTDYPIISDRLFFDSLEIERVEHIGDYRLYVKR